MKNNLTTSSLVIPIGILVCIGAVLFLFSGGALIKNNDPLPANPQTQSGAATGFFDELSDWQTYKNTVYHYQINYPADDIKILDTDFNSCEWFIAASGSISISDKNIPCSAPFAFLSGDATTTDMVIVNGVPYTAEGFIDIYDHRIFFDFDLNDQISVHYFTNPNLTTEESESVIDSLKKIIATLSTTSVPLSVPQPIIVVPVQIISPAENQTYQAGDVIQVQWKGYSRMSDLCSFNFVGPLSENGAGIESMTNVQEMGSVPCSHGSFSWQIPNNEYVIGNHYYNIIMVTPYLSYTVMIRLI